MGIRVRIVLFGSIGTSFSLSYDVNFGILCNRQAFETHKWKIQRVTNKFYKLMFLKITSQKTKYLLIGIENQGC